MASTWKKKIARHAGKVVVKNAVRGTTDHLRRRGPDYELQLATFAAVTAALALGLRAWRHVDAQDDED